jgi:hypothetical protein
MGRNFFFFSKNLICRKKSDFSQKIGFCLKKTGYFQKIGFFPKVPVCVLEALGTAEREFAKEEKNTQ